MGNNHLDLLYDCHRVTIDGRDERKRLNQSIRLVEQEKGFRYHATYRKKGVLNSPLYLVSSKAEGTPFAEVLMYMDSRRPLVGVAESVESKAIVYHVVLIEQVKGADKVREWRLEKQPTPVLRTALANLLGQQHEAGSVIYIESSALQDIDCLIRGDSNELCFSCVDDIKEEIPQNNIIPLLRANIERDKRQLKTRTAKHIPIPKTLRTKILNTTLATIVLAFLISLVMRTEEEKIVQKKASNHQEFINEFEKGYAPKAALYEIYRSVVGEADTRNKIGLRGGATGWTIKKVELSDRNILITMSGGANARLKDIQRLAKSLNSATLSIKQSEVVVVRELPERCRTPVLNEPLRMPIEGVINYLITNFKIVPSLKLELGRESSKANYALRDITIKLNKVSAETIDLVGTVLNFLPINFKGASFTSSGQNDLLDGSISLQVIGCALKDIDEKGLCKEV